MGEISKNESEISLTPEEQQILNFFNQLGEGKLIDRGSRLELKEAVDNLISKGFLEKVGILNHPQSQFWTLKRIK